MRLASQIIRLLDERPCLPPTPNSKSALTPPPPLIRLQDVLVPLQKDAQGRPQSGKWDTLVAERLPKVRLSRMATHAVQSHGLTLPLPHFARPSSWNLARFEGWAMEWV